MVSAGNTGALTAMAHFVLKTVGPAEPAPIMSSCRRATAATRHPRSRREHQGLGAAARAVRHHGSIVARDVFGIARPRVGLLNIGEEDTKGHELVQEAHELIRASGVNYLGFVEGNHIFDENVDVVVTDGFTGNVALKAMEGLAKLIVEQLRTEFTRNRTSKSPGCCLPGACASGEKLDPRRYNGACMVGLTAVVVKSHGSADSVAFAQAVATAATAMRGSAGGDCERIGQSQA